MVLGVFKRLLKGKMPDPFDRLKNEMPFIPDFYRTGAPFADFVHLLDSRDPRCVDRLLDVTKMANHFFSETFWRTVSDCAKELNLPAQVDYCNDQIEANRRELGHPVPHGWTTVRIGNSCFSHHIARAVQDGWDEGRRREHKVSSLLNEDGFHLVRGGRDGMIYYVESGRWIEIGWEMSGSPEYDILVGSDSASLCYLPDRSELTTEARAKLRSGLAEWLKSKGTRAKL